MGRRKIAIEPLTDDRNRTVTFVKRKAGLFKKAHELAVLCQVDLAVIIVGNNNKIYEFSSVDTPELIKSYGHCDIHEQKSPENYGNYKKKSHVHLRDRSHRDSRPPLSPKQELPDVPVDDADSDYDSESPEPKRHKPSKPSRQSTPSSMYSSKQSVGSRMSQFADAPKDKPSQRPVLRVQIPSDAKNSSSNDSAKTITALDTSEKKPHIKEENNGSQAGRFEAFSKSKAAQSKTTPQLPVPAISKSQTSSPSSAMAPQLPRNSGIPFFSSIPQASPGSYQPAILPTPVLNQVFNQQYMGQVSATAHGENTTNEEGANNNNENDDPQKYKPTFPPQFANPEQTPMSALPSRYVNDIFPSPSNLYPSQDWPSGMTSFPPNMPHYFVGMVPSGSGTTPMTGNPMFMNARGSLSSAVGGGNNPSAGGQRTFPPGGQNEEQSASQNNSSQPQPAQQSTSNTSPQSSDMYIGGQFNYKK
ncbi:hypothetical protein FT663_02362 [Candidozyma haemuli var. vulneris]|nr:hypothetical protein FT662_04854 [[Candida] haemuloni var. vulneris]KAF3992305.1 hypothetical protein FT663_02362 [[Candida] haemuloni var. vulneris]